MGMYDDIKFEMNCPKCGTKLENFQSKSGPCAMFQLDFWEVNNFYCGCSNCNSWVEFFLKERPNRKLKIKDYKMKVEISTKKEEKAHRKKYEEFAKLIYGSNKDNAKCDDSEGDEK